MIKNKKIILSILILFLALFSHPFLSFSADSPVIQKTDQLTFQTKVNFALLNGTRAKLDFLPVNTDKKMLVPARYTAEALGGNYTWNAKVKTVTITKDSTTIIFKINSLTATLNNKSVTLDIAPSLVNSSPAVPAKFLAEHLGAKYQWTAKTNSCTLTSVRKVLQFPDKNLEQAVRKQINKPSGDISLSDAQKLTSLYISQVSLSDLSGLQYCSNLKTLFLSHTGIRDISPLGSLTKLENLYLPNNQIADIACLASLKSLSELDLTSNQVSSVDALVSLPKLKQVYLWELTSLDEMQQMEEKAKAIVNQVVKPGMSQTEKELALHDYVVVHSHYDKVNYDNHSIPPESHNLTGILTKGVGVCDGYAEAMQLLLNTAGIECQVVYGDSFGPKDSGYETFGHAWNIVKVDGAYYHLDVTFDDPVNNDGKNTLQHNYFNLSDWQMSVSHKWNRTIYPACTQDNPDFNAQLAQDPYAVYSRDWIFKIYNDQIYRIKPDGSSSEKLCNDKAANLNLSGDWLYYNNLDDGKKLYKIKADGSEKSKVLDEATYFTLILDNAAYYINSSYEQIVRLSLDSGSKTVLASHDVISYFTIRSRQIYYRGYDFHMGSRLYKTDLNSGSGSAVISENLSGFTESSREVHYLFGTLEEYRGDVIYYINPNDNNRVYSIRTDGSGRAQLGLDSANDIEVCSSWVYYVNNLNNQYARVKTDGSATEELQ